MLVFKRLQVSPKLVRCFEKLSCKIKIAISP